MNIINDATTLPTGLDYVIQSDLLAYVSKQELAALNVPLTSYQMDEIFPLEENIENNDNE